VKELLLYDFLRHLQQSKTDELSKIQYELQMVNKDCKKIEESLSALKTKPDKLDKLLKSNTNDNRKKMRVEAKDNDDDDDDDDNDDDNDRNDDSDEDRSSASSESPTTTAGSNSRGKLESQLDDTEDEDNNGETGGAAVAAAYSSSSKKSTRTRLVSILNHKKRIINRFFDELNQTYSQAHNKDLKDFKIKGS
jgi:hypothetical protein